VNHPALVKTSEEPSFSSNFSPFWGSPSIRYQPCAKPELNPNPRGGTAKKITSSPCKNVLRQIRKRNQAGH
jgi:hypothetical protein